MIFLRNIWKISFFNNIYIRISLKLFRMDNNTLNAYIAMKMYPTDHWLRWLVYIQKCKFDQNGTFWNCFVKKMAKIITIFISEITHQYYVLYGFQPCFAEEFAPLCVLMIPKCPKFFKKSLFWHILGIFWAYLIPLNIIWSYFYFSFRKHSYIRSF